MIARLAGLALAALLAAVLLYLSPWWPFLLWSRDGLAGIEALRPQGDLLSRWLSGTPLARFDEILWLIGGMLVLSAVEAAWSRLVAARG